jgi:hypothetical protein
MTPEKIPPADGGNDLSWKVAIVSLTMASVLYVLSRTLADPDLWGHVLFGIDILGTRSIPVTDPYSYLTFGHPWINHELLSEIAFGLAFDWGGTPGLMLLKLAITLPIAVLVYRHLVRRGLDLLPAGVVVLVILFPMAPGLATIRPHLFTYLFFALTLLIIDRADRGHLALLWALPVLSAVWVNFHGGVLAGLGIYALWVSGTVLYSLLFRRRAEPVAIGRLVAVGVVSLAALAVNPYVWRLPLFLFETATVPRPDISEWRPIDLTSATGAVFLLVVLLGVVVIVRTRRKRRVGPLFALACVTILPLVSLRHLPLFALTFAIFMAEHIADTWAQLAASRHHPRGAEGRSRRHRAVLAGATIFAALVLAVSSIPSLACIPLKQRRFEGHPTRAMALLSDSGVKGNLAIHFDYGEFAIWHLRDRVLVSMDGRRETVYPDSVYSEALRFQQGVGAWDDVLDKRPTDMALVKTSMPTFNLLKLKPGWELVYEDALVGLFVRQAWPGAAQLRSTPARVMAADGENICFP